MTKNVKNVKMPRTAIRRKYKRKPRTTTRKVTYKRKSTRRNNAPNRQSALARQPIPARQVGRNPFNPAFMVRLHYNTTRKLRGNNTVAVSGGTPALAGMHEYKLNSLYDPDATGTGGQPYQFDQLAAIYRGYRVYGAKIVVTFTNPTADGMYVGIFLKPSSEGFTTSAKTLEYLREIGRSKTRPINNSGSQIVRFSEYIPVATVFSLPKKEIAIDASFAAPINADPLNTVRLQVYCLHTEFQEYPTVNFDISITFYAKMFDRVVMEQS